MEPNVENNHFKLPEGYFDGLPTRLQERLSHPLNEYAQRNEAFLVPDYYFDNLEYRLQQRLTSRSKETIPFWKNKWFSFSAAAALLLFLILRPVSRSEVPEFEDLARSDIEAYLEFSDSDFSAYEMAKALPITDVSPADFMEEVPHESQILNYLEFKTEAYDHYNFKNDE
ncbi:MAG: hypothetical protein RLZZ241_2467 [Bacteroidota bacterium]|jgi:hypothetical protein